MMGKPQTAEPKLFYHSIRLESRIPHGHPLRIIKQLIDFSFARSHVEHLYGKNGNISVDPAVILKLMFLLFYENVKSERALMEYLPLRLDWLWFCGYDLDDNTPDHSVISKARRRWGPDVFAEFFAVILQQCLDAGLVDGQTVHIDSSIIKANASKDSLRPQLKLLGQKFYAQLDEQAQPEEAAINHNYPSDNKDENQDNKDDQDNCLERRVSDTDPDARMVTKHGQSTLGYKDHRAVDDRCGIITATITTPANINDEKVLKEAVETHRANTNTEVKIVATDKAYGVIDNYTYLHRHAITPCIPHKQHTNPNEELFGREQFSYDRQRDCYICPAGNMLNRMRSNDAVQTLLYCIDRNVCQKCRYLSQCVKSEKFGRTISRKSGTEYMEWADTCLSKSQRRRLMARRKSKAEGSFADATNNHGFKRARWRGIDKMLIQNLMIAAIQNLRKLLRYLGDSGLPAAKDVENIAMVASIMHFTQRLRQYFRRYVSKYSHFKELYLEFLGITT